MYTGCACGCWYVLACDGVELEAVEALVALSLSCVSYSGSNLKAPSGFLFTRGLACANVEDERSDMPAGDQLTTTSQSNVQV